MGTMLHHSGSSIGACFDALNLVDPDLVLKVHVSFLDAGAEIIETNTFGANRYKLAEYHLAEQVAAINAAAVKIAKQACTMAPPGRDRYVAGAIGPLGVRLAPYGRVQPEQARAAFSEQIQAMVDAGVDALIFETFVDLNEIEQGILAARAINPNLPIIASMTFTRDDRTLYGDAPREVAARLTELSADVIGVNCSGGPSQLARIGQIMRAVEPDSLISVMPTTPVTRYC
jgi:homocysteine S-methyltransferase